MAIDPGSDRDTKTYETYADMNMTAIAAMTPDKDLYSIPINEAIIIIKTP